GKPERRAQIGGVLLAQAHEERAGAGQPHAVAALAEIVGQRRDHAEPAAGLAHRIVARRAARPIVALVERPAPLQIGPDQRQRQILLEPRAGAELAHRHDLDEGEVEALLAAPFDHMVQWCGEQGFDLTFIEVMPMGELGTGARLEQYLPLSLVRADLQRRWTLDESDYRTGGPARYYTVRETGGRLGMITPLTHNFCESCNRVRLTCTGTLFMCLGQEDAADLRAPLRLSENDEPLEMAIAEAISRKPKGHDFIIDRRHQRPAVSRHMSVTGG